MRTAHRPDGSLIVSDFPYWIGVLATAITIAIASRAAWAFSRSKLHGEEVFAASAGIAICIVAGVLMTKWTRFEFDRQHQIVTWSCRGLLRSRGGTLTFTEVDDVCVETLLTSPTVSSYRVSLMTARGVLPLSVNYGRGERAICERVRSAVQKTLASSD